MKKGVILFAFILLSIFGLLAQLPGTPDSTFNGNGIVTFYVDSLLGIPRDVAIQTDGKIVFAGEAYHGISTSSAVMRLNSDGTLDSTFSNEGIIVSPWDSINAQSNINSIAIQPDGKIVTGGTFSDSINSFVSIVRYNINGDLDSTFGLNGNVKTFISNPFQNSAKSVAIQTDNKILVAVEYFNGTSVDFSIIRYNTNGSVDSSFGTNGIASVDFNNRKDVVADIAIQPDGKIIAAGFSDTINFGSDFAVSRYNLDGTLDSSFNGNGKVIYSSNLGNECIRSIAIQPDGKIVAAGYSGSLVSDRNFMLLRIKIDGTIDSSFGLNGLVILDTNGNRDEANSVLIQPDGKIIVGGQDLAGLVGHFVLVKLNNDGTLDSLFGTNGIERTTIPNGRSILYSTAMQSDGKIVAVGRAYISSINHLVIVRYNNDLSLSIDSKKANNSIFIYPNPASNHLNITTSIPTSQPVNYQIINTLGEAVMVAISNVKDFSTDVSTLPSGIYFINLQSNNESKVKRFVKE